MMTEGYEMNCIIDMLLGNNSQEFEQPLCTKIEECKNVLKNLSAKKKRMLVELEKSKAKHVELRRKISILKKLRRDDGSMTNGSKIAELKEEIRELREAKRKLSMMTEGYEMNCIIDMLLGNNSQEFEQPLCTKIEECKNVLKNLSAKKNRMLVELNKSKAKHVELRRKVSILKKLRRDDDGIMTNGSKIAELKEEIRELREAKRKRDLEVCQIYMESQAQFKEALEEKLLASTMRVMVEEWKKAKKARNY